MCCSSTVIREAVGLCLSVLVHAFAIVILFICTHGSVVERLTVCSICLCSAPTVSHYTTWPVCVRVLPVCPCKGECGRGRVGEVLDVTIRLFLLLVRQLRREKNYTQSSDLNQRFKTKMANTMTLNLIGSSSTMAPLTWPPLWNEMTPLIQYRRCHIMVLLLHFSHSGSGDMAAIFVYCLLITASKSDLSALNHTQI